MEPIIQAMKHPVSPKSFTVDAQVSKPTVRVIGGKPRTARETDATEQVYSLSMRVFVLANRELRKVKASATINHPREQLLIEVIDDAKRLSANPSSQQTATAVSDLRQHLAKLTAA